jgi:hypothetical protein
MHQSENVTYCYSTETMVARKRLNECYTYIICLVVKSEQHNGKKMRRIMEEKLVFMGEHGRSAEETNKR